MAEFLLELLSEEMPARVHKGAAENLERLIAKGLTESELPFGSMRSFVTPRRLGLMVDALPLAQPDTKTEKRGPRVGAPEKALAGFCESNGITPADLEERETDKGRFYFAVVEREGRPTMAVLTDMLPPALSALPWPKSMRWGAGEIRWVRPIHGLLCLLNGDVVPITFAGAQAHDATRGHRTHGSEPLVVTSFADYENKLRAARVMLDAAERRQTIFEKANGLAQSSGLRLRHDEALLDELAGLVEWPVVLMGAIDEAYMMLPPEVLTAAMRNHQRYLATETADGELAPHFIVVANIEADDGGSEIVAGNERVLRARLADAWFFWYQDRKVSLSDRVPKLAEMVFQAKLGTLDAKVDRIEALAERLTAHLSGTDHDRVRSAARLCKADLVTAMVGEFPELQGTMGRYYALGEGEQPEVANAIAEHYAPQGPADRCPSAPTSVAVALADKIDTLVGFFAIDEKPTGSKDPFALRRAALGVIRLITENSLRIPLNEVFVAAFNLYRWKEEIEGGESDLFGLMSFFADRLKVHLREEGVRHDLVSAVFAVAGEDDLVRLLARVEALRAFLGTDDGANLLTAFKRANNIVEIEERKDGKVYDGNHVDDGLLSEAEEKHLHGALRKVQEDVMAAVDGEDFVGACRAFATLRASVDSFFDRVTVNTDDSRLRENRLRLLDMIRSRFLLLADFGQIEG